MVKKNDAYNFGGRRKVSFTVAAETACHGSLKKQQGVERESSCIGSLSSVSLFFCSIVELHTVKDVLFRVLGSLNVMAQFIQQGVM